MNKPSKTGKTKLQKFNLKNEMIQNSEDEILKKYHKEANKRVYLPSMQEAIHIHYGMPLVNMDYNADKGEYIFTIYSQFNSFEHIFTLPMEREKAREFKVYMDYVDVKPIIALDIVDRELKFKALVNIYEFEEILKIREKQEQEISILGAIQIFSELRKLGGFFINLGNPAKK